MNILLLVIALAALPPGAAQAQTTPKAPDPWAATKPATKPPAKPAAKPPAKPVAKPATKPTAKPAPQPTVAQPAPLPPAPVVPPPPTRQPPAPASASEAFTVGTNVVNLGIGLGNRYGYVGSGLSVSPAFSVSYERGILPLGPGTLGVGGFVGYQTASSTDAGFGYKFTDLVVAARGAFHYPLASQLDLYGGLTIGVRHAGVSFDGQGSSYASGTDAYAALFVGGRYYFSNSIGAFAELGYDQTFLKVGLSAKF